MKSRGLQGVEGDLSDGLVRAGLSEETFAQDPESAGTKLQVMTSPHKGSETTTETERSQCLCSGRKV